MLVLDKPKSRLQTYVFFLFTASDGRVKISTREQVSPLNWDFDTEREKGRGSQANKVLNRIAAHVEVRINERRATGRKIKAAELKAEMHALIGKQSRERSGSLLDFAHDLTSRRNDGRELTPGGKRFSAKTIAGYQTTINLIARYEVETKRILTIYNMDTPDLEALTTWMNDQGFALNTIGKNIKNVKVFLTAAFVAGLTTSTFYRRIRVPEELTPDIYLTIPELEALNALKLSGRPARVRDWFLIESFTGLRVSDATRLTLQNFESGKIVIANEKTDEKVVIPVHPIILQVLARNGGKLPGKLNEQRMNLIIKDLAQTSGICQQVLYTVTKAGRRVDQYFPKWQMVSHHTGRRSFITNMLRSGAPAHIVMKLAGIRKTATLERYNKLSPEETADHAAGLSFFTS